MLFGDFGPSYLGQPSASSASSPIIFVGGRTQFINSSTGTNTVVSLTGLTGGIDTGPAAGDFVVLGYSANNNNADFNVRMITSGWTEEADLHSPHNTFDCNFGVFHKTLGSGETSCTVGPTGSNADNGGVVLQVWRGVDSTTPMDVSSVAATSSGAGATKIDPGAITPVTQGAVIVITGSQTAESNTIGVLGDLENAFIYTAAPTTAIGSKVWSGSGAYDCVAWSGGIAAGGNSGWCVLTMALRPA
jgi:hypothetical protein